MTQVPKAPPPPKTKVDTGEFKEVSASEGSQILRQDSKTPENQIETSKESSPLFDNKISDSEFERIYGKSIQPTPPPKVEHEESKIEVPADESLDVYQKRINDAQAKMHEATQEAASWKKLAQTLIERKPIPSQPQEGQIAHPSLPDPTIDPQGYIETRLAQERSQRRQERIDDWLDDHPEYIQYWPKMEEMERLHPYIMNAENPVAAAYKLAKLYERLEGEKLAEEDFKQSLDQKTEAILNQEAYKTTQHLRKPTASSKEPIIPDFDKMTADEVWQWLENHPEFYPEDRIGKQKLQ